MESARNRTPEIIERVHRPVRSVIRQHGGSLLSIWFALLCLQLISSIYLSYTHHLVEAERSLKRQDQDAFPPSEEQQHQKMVCRFDGHCPVGMTCGIARDGQRIEEKTNNNINNNTNESPGVCQMFPIDDDDGRKPQQGASLVDCAQSCQTELEMDEHFFHESWPVIVGKYATTSKTRPKGCVLDFIRHDKDNTDHWKSLHAEDGTVPKYDQEPSIMTWDSTRFRHVVRVDPIIDADNNQSNRWRAYCTSPCQTDEDCRTDISPEPLAATPWQCMKGACQRNPAYWERGLNESFKPQMVLVTGASKIYMRGLRNLVASARYWAPHHRVVVYNLGDLSADSQDEIRSWSNVIALEWSDGIPKQYPGHISELKKYGWKPLILQETLLKYKSIFWLDAGSTLTGPVAPVENILKRNGIFLVKGQDSSMAPLSHPGTFKWFGFEKSTMKGVGPHFSGNTQAYMFPSRFYDTIVVKNAACAWDPTCISPDGSALYNHRYDQTSLSICAYHPWVRAPHHTEYLSASKENIKRNMLEPSYRFVLTSRQSSQDYVNVKGSFLKSSHRRAF